MTMTRISIVKMGYNKSKSGLFGVINSQNVGKHTKNLNIIFVVTFVGQNCGSLQSSHNPVKSEPSLSMKNESRRQ